MTSAEEYRTIQRNTSDINDVISNKSNPSLFADKLVQNDFISNQAANGIVQVPAFPNYNKVSQLMQAVDAQIRTASNPVTTFETFIKILRELSLDQLADKLVKFYRDLKPGYTGPLCSPGSDGPAHLQRKSSKRRVKTDNGEPEPEPYQPKPSFVKELKQAVQKVDNPRGLAVIVTNQYQKSKKKLLGTKKDGEKMEDAFKSLEFATLWNLNKSSEEMKDLVKSVVTYFQDNPIPKLHIVAFVFSGHGNHKIDETKKERKEGDVVRGEDGEDIWLKDEIVQPLAEEHKIGDIPKLFFIDACRGSKMLPTFDKGDQMPEETEPEEIEKRELVTTEGNYFLAYSTIPEHKAWMDPDDPSSGSAWMQILAKNLKKETNKSVADIVDITSKELWEKYENDHKIDMWEQPEALSRLHTGPVFLHPDPPGTSSGAHK